MGAAVSTLISYLIIFAVRAVHTRSMLCVRWSARKFLFSALLLGAQCVFMEKDVPLWPLWSGVCLLLVCAVHFKALLSAVRKSR